MPSLSTLKSRIASDLSRSDLTSQIANAIADAVAEYQVRRFWFNQARDTFITVAGTEFYVSGSDPEDIPTDIAEIDSLTVTQGTTKYTLDPIGFTAGETLSSNTSSRGRPLFFSWYAQQIRLYPVPDAEYTVTISYLQKIDIPGSDGSSNVWTTEAEALIRAAAKRYLFRDVLRNYQAASAAMEAEAVALRRLKRGSQQLETGSLMPSGF